MLLKIKTVKKDLKKKKIHDTTLSHTIRLFLRKLGNVMRARVK